MENLQFNSKELTALIYVNLLTKVLQERRLLSSKIFSDYTEYLKSLKDDEDSYKLMLFGFDHLNVLMHVSRCFVVRFNNCMEEIAKRAESLDNDIDMGLDLLDNPITSGLTELEQEIIFTTSILPYFDRFINSNPNRLELMKHFVSIKANFSIEETVKILNLSEEEGMSIDKDLDAKYISYMLNFSDACQKLFDQETEGMTLETKKQTVFDCLEKGDLESVLNLFKVYDIEFTYYTSANEIKEKISNIEVDEDTPDLVKIMNAVVKAEKELIESIENNGPIDEISLSIEDLSDPVKLKQILKSKGLPEEAVGELAKLITARLKKQNNNSIGLN